jgi:23S rRNA (adenine2503-C2)-methyltransferase
MKTSIYNKKEIEKVRKSLKLDPHIIKNVYNQYLKKASTAEEISTTIPESENFTNLILWNTLNIKDTISSDKDGATKLLFETYDNHHIESVILRIKSGRSSLCISSQIGCAMNCRFCATGSMGFIRNLTEHEILDQISLANQFLKKENRQIRNIVFMGMGEPLNNQKEVFSAIRKLTDPKYFNLSIQHITISTVGILSGITELLTQFPYINLALSLHCAREEIRQTIIPISKKYNLNKLKSTLLDLTENYERESRYIFIEYLMIDGITDTDADIEALKNWCAPLPIHLNIIKYNPDPDEHELKPSSDKQIEYFINQLKPHIATITTRYSLGSDITAACGQLANKKIKEQ